jgi:hypothetical protein
MEATMLHSSDGARRRTWRELDALVLEEVEALLTRQQPGRAASTRPLPERMPMSEDALDEATTEAGGEAGGEEDGEALAEARDEEAFIDRCVDFLRDRPDADALLEAIRAALAEADGEPLAIGEAAEGGGDEEAAPDTPAGDAPPRPDGRDA